MTWLLELIEMGGWPSYGFDADTEELIATRDG